jgi:uncharacterized protein (TIGR02757 family)
LKPEQKATLKERLESLYLRYRGEYIHTDPIALVHEYASPQDREVVGLIASSLAYGNVKQIQASLRRVLDVLGESPCRTVRGSSPEELLNALRGFKHRFNTGKDIACLLFLVQQALNEHGTLSRFFELGYREDDEHLGPALERFVGNLTALNCSPFYPKGALPEDAGVRFLLPSPRKGSACKRLNLYLRWMVRRNDGVDFGIWKKIPPSKLVIPLDTHLARISRHLSLTGMKTAGWRMALQVTESLRELDPLDPIKYDFALCRLGIMDLCPKKSDPQLCTQCQIEGICQFKDQL